MVFVYSGLPGEYVDQGIVKPVMVEPQIFTSIATFTSASLKDMIDHEKTKEKLSRRGKFCLVCFSQ